MQILMIAAAVAIAPPAWLYPQAMGGVNEPATDTPVSVPGSRV